MHGCGFGTTLAPSRPRYTRAGQDTPTGGPLAYPQPLHRLGFELPSPTISAAVLGLLNAPAATQSLLGIYTTDK